MAITVDMIEKKQFKRLGKGYDPDDVDEFLDEVCEEFIAMQQVIEDLNGRLAVQTMRPQPAVPPVHDFAPIVSPKPDFLQPQTDFVPLAAPKPVQEPARDASSENDESFKRLLRNAQRVCDETIDEAKKEAEDILEKAHQQVDEELSGLTEKRDQIKTELENLKMSALEYRERYRALVEEQSKLLDSQTDLFEA